MWFVKVGRLFNKTKDSYKCLVNYSTCLKMAYFNSFLHLISIVVGFYVVITDELMVFNICSSGK